MKVFFIYAGKRGSNLECAIALHSMAGKLGFDSELVLSKDNDRSEKVGRLYPEARFVNFFSPKEMLSLCRELGGNAAFFTMVSPKILPIYLASRARKALYFHATFDHSFSGSRVSDLIEDSMHDFLIRRSDLVVATQYPLAWQIMHRLGREAGMLPHPLYSGIRKEFFRERREVKLPFSGYFLTFGGIERKSKGTGTVLRAVEGTDLRLVLAGKMGSGVFGKNVHHVNRWVSDAELYSLIEGCECVVLPYLVPSQFSGCLALAYRLGKPVIAPFSPAFERLIDDGKTGLFFSQGDWEDLRKKMLSAAAGRHRFSRKAIAMKERELSAATERKLRIILREFLAGK